MAFAFAGTAGGSGVVDKRIIAKKGGLFGIESIGTKVGGAQGFQRKGVKFMDVEERGPCPGVGKVVTYEAVDELVLVGWRWVMC